MRINAIPTPGAYFEGRYPFVSDTFTRYDGDGLSPEHSWRPGTRIERFGPEDVESVADGEGSIILTVVSVHKPGKFPCRVFFTRRWRDPSGKEFGRGELRCTTVAQFYKLAKGYRHPYRFEFKKSIDADFPMVLV